ncbi:hypothetical protein RGQ13_08635 [Thalassotalea psychrophila]|uniref:Uncharacterized protein n=1 Tax=Thalassotalea psychrophila TaxID=3065647 RepID=A0ABY9U371_9GAMM|nr:hypothetical protein RGQ13_08635 [Colwelliaceae bacterium SQ149]
MLIEKGYISVVSERNGCKTIYHVNKINAEGNPVVVSPTITESIKNITKKGRLLDETNRGLTTEAKAEVYEIRKAKQLKEEQSKREQEQKGREMAEAARAFGGTAGNTALDEDDTPF